MKHLYVISYDISNNRKRTKASDLLGMYGKRVNYSVFECMLTTRRLKEVLGKLAKLTKPQTDRVNYYHVCRECYGKSGRLGPTEGEPPLVAFV